MRTRRVVLAALSAVPALFLAGCGPEPETIRLTAVGASFPFPMYSNWFAQYRQVRPQVVINYQPSGSGAGVKQVTDGTVDFGGSDQPLTEEQLAKFREKRGFGLLHFPTVLGAVVPTYNLPGVNASLNFTPEALAGIFLGKITRWDDPAIASANPAVSLPAAELVVVHRSDGSGTTYIWTDYLSKVNADWAAGPGRGTSVKWPVGLGGKGSAGLTGQVKQTPYSIGYVEMVYAKQNKMPMGKIQNAAGNFVQATAESVTAAAAGVPMPDDFRVSITNAAGASAFPIASFTWMLIPEEIQDPVKREELKAFLNWMLDAGQTMASAMDYAPLPREVIAMEQAQLAGIH